MVHEQGNIFATLPERWHQDMDDVQAVEEILPERALLDHLAQVAIGGRDHPDVDDAAAAVGPDLLQFARLEEPQQQSLHPQRHLTHFVEKYRAQVGHLELAGLVAVRPREAPLHVPEEFRFEEGFRKPRAIDRGKCVRSARTAHVNPSRNDFFSDAARAGDEDLRVRTRHALDLLLERDDGWAATDQVEVHF